LDSWTFWDEGFNSFIAYYTRSKHGLQSGVKAVLDWDDTDGYGPETTSLYGIGSCKSKCILKFHVDNYTPDDGKLGDSGVVVQLLRDKGVFKEFPLPRDPSNNKRGYTVFTMDASTDPPQVYDGNWAKGPFLTADTAEKTWSKEEYWDMTGTDWQRLPGGAVLYNLQADGNNHLFKLDTVRYYHVQNANGFVRTEQDWSGVLAGGGKASCPAGSWMSGLYRSGTAYDATGGGYQLTKAECISFTGITQWGKCQDIDTFQDGDARTPSDGKCPIIDGKASAFVGLKYVNKDDPNHNKLSGLKLAECCTFPDELVQDQANDCTADFCAGEMGNQ